MSKISQSLIELSKKSNEQMRVALGDGIYPNWQECRALWERRVQSLPPRSFIYVVDNYHFRTILSHGMSIIGYENDEAEITYAQMLQMIHENHRQILGYYSFKVNEVLQKHKDILVKGGFSLGTLRALLDKNGTAWLTYQTSEPFQFDSENQIRSYLTWTHVLSKYKGEGIRLEVFHAKPKQFYKEVNLLQLELDAILEETLLRFGFSNAHLDILLQLGAGYNLQDVADIRRVDLKTIRNQCPKIVEKAREVFPASDFQNINSVVSYLKNQAII